MSCDYTHIIDRAEPRVGGPVSVCRNCDKTWGKWIRAVDYVRRDGPPTYVLIYRIASDGTLVVSAPEADH